MNQPVAWRKLGSQAFSRYFWVLKKAPAFTLGYVVGGVVVAFFMTGGEMVARSIVP